MKIPGISLNTGLCKQLREVGTDILVNFQILSHELDFGVWILHEVCQTLLDGLDLLRYGTENSLFKPIELVEATPGSNLTEADEYAAHCLEIKRFVATEYKNKTTKLNAKSFHRFGFSYIKIIDLRKIEKC